MMVWHWAGALSVAMLVATSAQGQNRPKAVVELFTSQGCSSCPPADALLGDLAREPDMIALTLPIDYWDYLGWKDTLASPQHSERQRAYGEARGDRKIYTPQAVVNGVAHAVGHDRQKIDKAMRASEPGSRTLVADVALSRRGGGVVVDIGAADRARDAEVWLLWIEPLMTVRIDRGENTGREIAYHNVVRRLQMAGRWNGAPASLEVADVVLGPGQKLAVLVQATKDGKPGAILAAAVSAPEFAGAMAGRWR